MVKLGNAEVAQRGVETTVGRQVFWCVEPLVPSLGEKVHAEYGKGGDRTKPAADDWQPRGQAETHHLPYMCVLYPARFSSPGMSV